MCHGSLESWNKPENDHIPLLLLWALFTCDVTTWSQQTHWMSFFYSKTAERWDGMTPPSSGLWLAFQLMNEISNQQVEYSNFSSYDDNTQLEATLGIARPSKRRRGVEYSAPLSTRFQSTNHKPKDKNKRSSNFKAFCSLGLASH